MNLKNKMLNFGIDLTNPERLMALKKFSIEPPVRIGGCMIIGSIKVGCFTYLHDGFLHNVEIGRYCSIGKNFVCLQPNHVIDNVSTHPLNYQGYSSVFSDEVIQASGFKGLNKKLKVEQRNIKKTIIGHDVWIGTNVTILSGVKVGNGSIIGAGSVVTKDVPDYAVVVGNPAKIIKFRFDNEIINRLQNISWWDYDPAVIAKLDFTDPERFVVKLSELIEKFKIQKIALRKIIHSDILEA